MLETRPSIARQPSIRGGTFGAPQQTTARLNGLCLRDFGSAAELFFQTLTSVSSLIAIDCRRQEQPEGIGHAEMFKLTGNPVLSAGTTRFTTAGAATGASSSEHSAAQLILG